MNSLEDMRAKFDAFKAEAVDNLNAALALLPNDGRDGFGYIRRWVEETDESCLDLGLGPGPISSDLNFILTLRILTPEQIKDGIVQGLQMIHSQYTMLALDLDQKMPAPEFAFSTTCMKMSVHMSMIIIASTQEVLTASRLPEA